MSMPGYTAESSLTPTSTSYRTIATGTSHASGVVVPQGAVKCLAACLCCAKYHNGFCCDYCEICIDIIFGDLVATTGGILA
jgi:hypothetical protein